MKLVPLKKSDLSFLLEVRNHESTRKNLENDSKFTLEQCKAWYDSINPLWFIIYNSYGDKVGYFRTKGSDIGCDIHPKFRRKGYARKAFEIYLQNKKYATLWVFEDNFAKDFYTTLGFIESGKTKTIRGKNYLHMVYEN